MNPQVELLKIFGGSVKTDRQLAKGPKGADVRANNIAQKVKRAGLQFDKTVIDGDSSKNAKEFDGLNRRLTGKQLITMAANGAVLTLKKLDLAIDQTVGSNNNKIIVCSKAVRRQISDLVIAAAGGAAVADVKAGVMDYKGCPIEEIDEDGDTNPILDFDETCGSSNVTASLYVVNPSGETDEENMRGLVRSFDGNLIDQVPYGERSGFVEDLVECVAGIALHHPRCATRLAGILST